MIRDKARNLPVRRLAADLDAMLYGPPDTAKTSNSVSWADNAPPYKNRGVSSNYVRPAYHLFWAMEKLAEIEERKTSLLMMKDEVVWFDLLYGNLLEEEHHFRAVVQYYQTPPTLP